jgi:hypothetical protein
MSSSIISLAKDLYKTIAESDKRKVKPYDSDATVVEVEDDVAWVKIPGGVDVTPVKKTINAKEGDKVKIRVSDHRAWITGNNTAPPTDDTRANEAETSAKSAHRIASEAFISAENAEKDAARAKVAAENAEADAALAHDAAGRAENSALSAQQSAAAAGISASGAEAASQAAQAAALGSITTDTLHYLATDLASNITTDDPPAGHGSWSTTVQTMTPTFKYLWTYHTYVTAGGVPTSTTPVLTGTYGEKGADGTSVTILGSYNTLAELEAAHPTGNLGDAYMVAGDLYVWNGSIWQDVGQIQGPQGPQGISGTSVTIQSISYAVTSTDSEPQTYPYPSPPTVPEGSWLWTKTTFSNGSSAIMKAKQGSSPTITTTKNGKTTTIYADGASIGTVIDGTDGSSPTVSKSGDTVTIIDASGNRVTIKDGTDGQSIKGDDGEDAFFHVAWANSADGLTDFSTTVAANKLYMGTYTDHTQTDSQIPGNYKWVRVKGDTGSRGPQGNPGVNGDDGISVVSVQPQYYLHISPTATQQEIDSWNWSLTLTYIPGKYIWTRDYITYSEGPSSTSQAIYNEALTQSCLDAATALGLIQEQQEYFWHDSLGAHVLSSTDDTETRYRTDVKGAGLEIFEVPANDLEVSVATFGANGSRVGAESSGHTTVQASGMQIFGNDGTITLANIGYGPGNADPEGQSPTGNAPYYSLGQRTGSIGNYSVAEGINTTASGYSSHAEGSSTTASGSYSHAEGSSSTASNVRAHAEGNSLASGEAAHAEGSGTQATGDFSHAEGHDTWASNEAAHAEGYASVASGLYSHAQNLGTRATAEAQTVIGKYNEALVPNASAQYAFIIGNGDSNAGSDALRVGWNGNVYPAGKVVSTEQGSMLGTGNLSSSGNNHSYSINAGATKSQSFTISRPGYYPLCIDRINLGGTGSDKICLNKSGITARAYGSVTYEVAYYNPTSTNYDSIIVAVYVLWVKI